MKKFLLTLLLILGFAVIAYAAWDGATNFPGSLDDAASVYDVEDDGTVEDEHHDALAQAVIAIETKIGTGADTPAATDIFVGTGAGTSGWATDIPTAVTIGTGYIYRAGGTDVAVADGGTGLGSLTDHSVLVGSGASDVTPISVGAAKEVLKGVTGADPVFAVERAFSVTNKAAANETPINITEAEILAARFVTNQGATSEGDLVLPALSYYVSIIFIVNEALIIEINPPSGEIFDLDGVSLDADDCVDSPIGIGAKLAATRMLLADGSTWRWSLDTIRGIWSDTGATD